MRRIYIIESISKFREDLVSTISGVHQVAVCMDAEQALEDIKSFMPDLIVMDMTMPELDGIGLLNILFTAGIRPKLVVSMNYTEDAVQHILSRFRVSFLLSRPVRKQMMLDRITDVLLGLDGGEELDKRRIANSLLLKLGMRLDLQGYRYTLEAVIYACNNINCMMTNELYPDVAKRLGGNGKQVEHSIRCCIQKAWENRDERIWGLYFPRNRYGNLTRLNNSTFLKRIAFAVNDFYDFYTQDAVAEKNA